MLAAQKKLLAEIEAVEKHALSLLDRGVKVAPVVQKLRAARDEMSARVRYLEKPKAPPLGAPAPLPAPHEPPKP